MNSSESTAEGASHQEREEMSPAAQMVQYLFFRSDSSWRRLLRVDRDRAREEFAQALDASAAAGVTTYTYSTLGFKASSDLLLWRKSDSPELLQETLCELLQSGLGKYLELSHVLFGFTRPSVYTKRRTLQEQAIDAPDRLRYLIVYPFSKTTDWYLMSREARQGMMNEHMRVGHEYSDVRQLLLYATGLDDQEFVVAYETDDLTRHQQLVIDLRSTEGRRFTLRDTPIFTAIHRPIGEALALLG